MIRAASVTPRVQATENPVPCRPTTPLWALAEHCAAVTKTDPKRWLRYGEVTLRLALAHLGEKGDVRKRAAFLIWACRHYAGEATTSSS